MYRIKYSISLWAWIGLLLSACNLPLMAQDSPVSIKLYLFAMDEMEIKQILKDGITRTELDSLQNEMFIQNKLLESEEPITLSADGNNIEIPTEKITSLTQDKSTVVFFYEVMPAEGTDEINEGTLSRNSFVVTEKEEKVLVRDGVWKYPAKLSSYRYFDFRYANVLGHVEFVYELTVDFGSSSVVYNISIK